jgi:hypothetical protein
LSSGNQTNSFSQLSGEAGSFEAIEGDAGNAQSQLADAGVVPAGSDRVGHFNSSVSGGPSSLESESMADLEAGKQGSNPSDKGQQSAASWQDRAAASHKSLSEQSQDLQLNDKNSSVADKTITTAMAKDGKDNLIDSQDATGQMKNKAGDSRGRAANEHSLGSRDEKFNDPSLGPKELRTLLTSVGTMPPASVTDLSALQSDLPSVSSLPASPVMTGEGPALLQSDLQATPSSDSGAAEGPIQGQTSAAPIAPDPAIKTSSIETSLWSRLVNWYVRTFKR